MPTKLRAQKQPSRAPGGSAANIHAMPRAAATVAEHAKKLHDLEKERTTFENQARDQFSELSDQVARAQLDLQNCAQSVNVHTPLAQRKRIPELVNTIIRINEARSDLDRETQSRSATFSQKIEAEYALLLTAVTKLPQDLTERITREAELVAGPLQVKKEQPR